MGSLTAAWSEVWDLLLAHDLPYYSITKTTMDPGSLGELVTGE